MTLDEQLSYLTKGCVDVVRAGDLRARLEQSAKTGRPLVVKVGFDPTAPDLHLGHTVLIRKMKHFQDLGHTVVYVVGAFTALIGDPTGRSKTRPPLTVDEIAQNAETYKTQIFKILDPQKTVVRFNSEWLEPLGSAGWVKLAAKYNVAQMLERRDFKKRYEAGQPIAVHEFLYPLAQAYDSVVLAADVELGGTDQLFNLNVGRDIMPSYDLPPQIVMTTPLLEGLDGVEKMSKSLGNYVGVTEAPAEMFGKLMSISDELMWRYYTLLTDLTPGEIKALRGKVDTGEVHPKAAKVNLAKRIVADFHDEAAAELAAEQFERRVVRKDYSDWAVDKEVFFPIQGLTLPAIIAAAQLAQSSSEATRKLQEGAVFVDNDRAETELPPRLLRPYRPDFILRIGRKVSRVIVRPNEEALSVIAAYRATKRVETKQLRSRMSSTRVLRDLFPGMLIEGELTLDSVTLWNQTPEFHPLFLLLLRNPAQVDRLDRALAALKQSADVYWPTFKQLLFERPLLALSELGVFDKLNRRWPSVGLLPPDASGAIEFRVDVGMTLVRLRVLALDESAYWKSLRQVTGPLADGVNVGSGPHPGARLERAIRLAFRQFEGSGPKVLCVNLWDPLDVDFAQFAAQKALDEADPSCDSVLTFVRQELNSVHARSGSGDLLTRSDREQIREALAEKSDFGSF
jgi:tyrosyl-tRNA synthetase